MTTPPPGDDKPQSLLDKFATALPIGLTALATVFAGLSTSELEKAMLWRTAASQDQAKATNQWTFAGLKRNRALIMEGNAAQLRRPRAQRFATPSAIPGPTPAEKEAAEWLAGEGPPRVALPEVEDAGLRALLGAIRTHEPEDDILKKAAKVETKVINRAIEDAENASAKIDADWGRVLDRVSGLTARRMAADPDGTDGFQAARFAMEQRRYRAESDLEQGVGYLYEARVRVVTAISDAYRRRSQALFVAMLVAQIGTVVSTLALARKRRSELLLLAALVGAAAVGLGVFVYLTI